MQDESLPKVHSATKHMAHLAHCDCACVLEPPLGPVAPSLSGPWTTDTRTVSVDLKQEWRAYFNPRGPVGVAVLNRAAQRLLSQFEPSVVPDRLAGQPDEDVVGAAGRSAAPPGYRGHLYLLGGRAV